MANPKKPKTKKNTTTSKEGQKERKMGRRTEREALKKGKEEEREKERKHTITNPTQHTIIKVHTPQQQPKKQKQKPISVAKGEERREDSQMREGGVVWFVRAGKGCGGGA